MVRHERLTLEDTLHSAIMKMVDGNVGAISVLCDTALISPHVDPMSAFGDMSAVVALDSLGIYGPRIWMLYKDVCESNPVYVLAVLRGRQLGIISKTQIEDAIDGARASGHITFDIQEVMKEVFHKLDGKFYPEKAEEVLSQFNEESHEQKTSDKHAGDSGRSSSPD